MMIIADRTDTLTLELTANWSSALKRFKRAVEASGNGLTVDIQEDDGRYGTLTIPEGWDGLDDLPSVGSHWRIYPNYYTQ